MGLGREGIFGAWLRAAMKLREGGGLSGRGERTGEEGSWVEPKAAEISLGFCPSLCPLAPSGPHIRMSSLSNTFCCLGQ